MRIVQSADPTQGIEAMATRISDVLSAGRKVLWLVCGGSNISVAAKTLDRIRTRCVPEAISNLTIGLTDERYGAVGHKDSNWQQLIEMNVYLHTITLMSILIGKSLEATVDEYDSKLQKAITDIHAKGGSVVAMFGIGADGHISGILPNTKSTESDRFVFGYEAGPYIRITTTFKAILQIDVAYAFAFSGGSTTKIAAIQALARQELDLEDQPAQILKKLPEATLYTDIAV